MYSRFYVLACPAYWRFVASQSLKSSHSDKSAIDCDPIRMAGCTQILHDQKNLQNIWEQM